MNYGRKLKFQRGVRPRMWLQDYGSVYAAHIRINSTLTVSKLALMSDDEYASVTDIIPIFKSATQGAG